MKVSVIGSGVVGLTIAFRLAQNGAVVTVFERSQLAKKASWAGAGILPPSNDRDPNHPLEHLQSLSNRIHPELSVELQDLTGIDNEFHRCGGIYLGRTVGETASLVGTQELWLQQGIDFEQLSPQELAELEPNFAKEIVAKVKSAIRVPTESQLRNPRHLKALIAACQKLGVKLRPETPVHEFKSCSNSIKVCHADGNTESDYVCVATGAWTSRLVTQFKSVQVIPIKGHMLLYKLNQPVFQHIINEANRYIVCRRDGHVLVGSSEEETGFDESESKIELDRLKQFAVSLVPTLNDSSLVQTWTGLRPMAYDQLPYIGPHSEFPRIILAAGHYRAGLHLSPGTAEVICNMVFDRQNEFDVAPLRPNR